MISHHKYNHHHQIHYIKNRYYLVLKDKTLNRLLVINVQRLKHNYNKNKVLVELFHLFIELNKL